MARIKWLEADSTPALEEHLTKLEHFTQSMADGVIDKKELTQQENNLVSAMKAVEGDLSDAQHDKVTKLLAELMAYTIMQTLSEVAATRPSRAAK